MFIPTTFHFSFPFFSKRLDLILNSAILKMEPVRSQSTIANYRTATRSFIRYAGQDASIRDVNILLIEGYERWLKQEHVTRNTSSCYMRSLRKLFNVAGIKNGNALFKSVFTGNDKTEKRAISKKDMCRLLYEARPDNPHLRLAQELFVFSFNCMGLPFVDLAFLRKDQMKNGYIFYNRQKTGQSIRIRITDEEQTIINMYAREDSPYIFPLLSSTDPKKAMKEYEALRRRYNRNLSKLATLMNIPHITSYRVRHTWASIAYAEGTIMPIISKALGHTNSTTTQIYISEIDDNRVDEANAAIKRKMRLSA